MTQSRTMRHFGLFLFLGLLMAAFSSQAALQDMAGKPKSISDYTGKGKWTVVMIWASDCHICNREAHQYVDFHYAHSDDDAEVLGISTDGPSGKAAAEGFIKKHNINFPNLIGDIGEVSRIFTELTGAPFVGTPAFLIYDPKGELKAQQIGAVPVELIEEFMKSQSVAAAK